MKFISQLLSNWHHGRGSKYTKKGNFHLALRHFQGALKYAKTSGCDSTVPLELECVARTLVRLGEYEQAKKYAEESRDLYKLQGSGRVFDEGVRRVTELMKIIERRGSI